MVGILRIKYQIYVSPCFISIIREKTMKNVVTIFMCGDVMTGRGIDQVLPYPGDPVIYEPFLRMATGYVKLAEAVNGPIAKPVDFSYIWGDALGELERMAPDVRIINLETAITKSDEYWEGKEINYRMNPDNISCLTAAKIDCCSLANNHVLDWGYPGMIETLETLERVNVKSAGAGRNLKEAETPAILHVKGKGRVIVFSFGTKTSGIPFRWAAKKDSPGINLLEDLSTETVRRIRKEIGDVKQAGDIVVASIHWGGNWGYEISGEQREFARGLADIAGVDVIHGHSSHHVKGIEVYAGKLIIYGCGDFIDDYEGIGGYEYFRGDLGLMYFAGVDPLSGKLAFLQMKPTQIKRFRINAASREDAIFLRNILNMEGKRLRTRVELGKDTALTLRWD